MGPLDYLALPLRWIGRAIGGWFARHARGLAWTGGGLFPAKLGAGGQAQGGSRRGVLARPVFRVHVPWDVAQRTGDNITNAGLMEE